jgi:NAD(P)-dependent dehydrogenase (short-subunit alcohol dehydrogenase family)
LSDIALITGGSRGIGAATSRRLAANGYQVAINYRSGNDTAEKLASELRGLGAKVMTVQGDVGSEDDICRMFAEVEATLGVPTALVNSAGLTGGSFVSEFDNTALQNLMRVNVIGTMLCCREAIQRMSTNQGGAGGAIVNVSSMAATIGGRPGRSHYAASKAAIDSFTRGFAKEVATQGVRVNAVRPGITLTDMTAEVRDNPKVRAAVTATIAMNRAAEADEVAAPIAWLLSREASFVSGCLLDVSGGGFVISSDTENRPGD